MNFYWNRVAFTALFLLSLGIIIAYGDQPASSQTPLHVLIVGGGPDPSHNQVAIESNVRYVRRLLPKSASARILFADGNPRRADVLYQDAQSREKYRRPHLPAMDGPCRLDSFGAAFRKLRTAAPDPLMLYFTGHGSPGDDGGFENNDYDMWGDDTLSVRRLGLYLDSLPAGMPVTLVMVECFSGAFGNLIFTGGDPQAAPTDKDLCGFFASVAQREAAGCTSEVNEAEYHDFTSYFFAALSGQDRLGRPVTGADYNHDGMVGMNEAFAYALIHDPSIDTPVCTSDVFLRRFVKTSDAEVFGSSYADVREWASPAQRAALDSLSTQMKLTGDNRLAQAFRTFRATAGRDEDEEDEVTEAATAKVIRFVRLAKSIVLAHDLPETATAAIQARYASLRAAEARNPLRATP